MIQLIGILLPLFLHPVHASGFDSTFYHQHYALKDPYTKKIDNHGNGYDALYGLRNMREVLNGVLYRGGANNAYNKHHKRSNMNPLPNEGIDNLCREGFGAAIYLYPDNYQSAPHQENCASIRGPNHFDYLQLDPQAQSYEILKLVYAAIFNPARGPIYVHCWNGWHASGLISALALRQFCGVSGPAAVKYWLKNTDGNKTAGMANLEKKIRDFKPFTDLQINRGLQAALCPKL